MANDVADIDTCTKRFNRLMQTTQSYVVPLSTPPLKRSFSSDAEIKEILLESDEILCLDIRNTPGHPYAPKFYVESDIIDMSDFDQEDVDAATLPITASDAPVHRVRWLGSCGNDHWQDSEEADKNDIIEAQNNYRLFGVAPEDSFGYHNIIDNHLYTTSPFVKITQAPWTRTTECQSPMSYTTAIIFTAIALAPKDGLDVNLLQYAERKSSEFRQMIRQGAMILPADTQYGLTESGA